MRSVRRLTASTPLQQISATASHSLHDWTPVTPSDIVKLIGAAANKTCQLDPVPTWLVKRFSSLLAPFITLFFNRSLTLGVFGVGVAPCERRVDIMTSFAVITPVTFLPLN